MQEIGKALPSVFKGHMQGANPPLVEVLAPLWACVAGKSVAARSRPIAFDAGTLTLAAESPSWATQLGSMAEEIRAKVNSFLGAPMVRRLRVKIEANVRPEPGLGSAIRPSSLRRRALSPSPTLCEAPPVGTALPCGLQLPTGGVKLDPEIAKVLERSFAKYFSRGGSKPD